GDPAPLYRAWQNWRKFRAGRSMPPDLATAVSGLEHHLFAQGGTWDTADARRFERAAQSARPRHVRRGKQSALPPLNPIS
ncbi:MAG TPA: hypothetical protein VIG49_12405, partial [Acetobacteraceae bacterium]